MTQFETAPTTVLPETASPLEFLHARLLMLEHECEDLRRQLLALTEEGRKNAQEASQQGV